MLFSFERELRKAERICAGTTTLPSSNTLTGKEIEIPRSRLVARIVNVVPFASRYNPASTGNVGFLPATFSARETASTSFSLIDSIFIYIHLLLLLGCGYGDS